jgi:23S rRNA (cytidine2498-2'-O)-methyltransferase
VSVLFSVAADSYEWAVREVRGEFGREARIERVSGDLGRVTGPSAHEFARACDAGRIMFVRHLTTEIGSFAELPPSYELAELVLGELPDYPKALAVQAWTDGAGTGGSRRPSRSAE